MTEYSVYIIVPDDAPPEARKDLEKLEHETYADEEGIHMVIGIPFMLHKGLKYIPTIISWALEGKGSYGNDDIRVRKKHLRLMKQVYEELASKVDVKIEASPLGGRRGLWPCETLDLKEVQDEALILAKSDKILLRMDDKRDYWMLFESTIANKVHPWWETLPFKERVRKTMEQNNRYFRAWGNFFLKALELHKKYPNVRYWFTIEMI